MKTKKEIEEALEEAYYPDKGEDIEFIEITRKVLEWVLEK